MQPVPTVQGKELLRLAMPATAQDAAAGGPAGVRVVALARGQSAAPRTEAVDSVPDGAAWIVGAAEAHEVFSAPDETLTWEGVCRYQAEYVREWAPGCYRSHLHLQLRSRGDR